MLVGLFWFSFFKTLYKCFIMLFMQANKLIKRRFLYLLFIANGNLVYVNKNDSQGLLLFSKVKSFNIYVNDIQVHEHE